MPTVTLVDWEGTGYNPDGSPRHGRQMMDFFNAAGPAAGWEIVHRDLFEALDAGEKFIVAGYPPDTVQGWREPLETAGAVAILSQPLFDPKREVQGDVGLQWPMVFVQAGAYGRGDLAIPTLGYGPTLWAVVQTVGGAVAPSWAAAQTAALLTHYPEAATDPQAAVIRWLAGLSQGSARWTERTGFGSARVRSRALVGNPVRVGDLPTSNVSYTTGLTKTQVVVAGQTDAWRYTCADVRHPFLAAYRSMPAAAAGQGLRWTFYAKNHHETQAVRIRARNAMAFVVLAPGEEGTYSLDVLESADTFFIETTAPQFNPLPDGGQGGLITGGAVDVTVASLRQDVYAMTDAPAPLAPAGGALSPLVSVVETDTPGKVLVSMTPLGGVGASVRVDGVERLQTAGDSATLYLPAGVSTIEARALLAGGGVTEAHQPGTLALDVPLGYVPPAPALEVQRQGASLLVVTEAEGATGYTITAQAGAEPPVTVEGGEVEWPTHLPARVVATAVGAGGTSSATATCVPAVRSAAPLVEGGLHPRLTLA